MHHPFFLGLIVGFVLAALLVGWLSWSFLHSKFDAMEQSVQARLIAAHDTLSQRFTIFENAVAEHLTTTKKAVVTHALAMRTDVEKLAHPLYVVTGAAAPGVVSDEIFRAGNSSLPTAVNLVPATKQITTVDEAIADLAHQIGADKPAPETAGAVPPPTA